MTTEPNISISLQAVWLRVLRSLACCAAVLLVPGSQPLRAAEFDPAPPVPPGFQMIEGDIIVPLPPPGTIQPAGTFLSTATDYWPNGVVPYEFSTNVTAIRRNTMLAAMQKWEDVANVNFTARSGQANHIFIQNSTGNSSSVGMVGGQQPVNITNWYVFVIAHELGHTLGLWHEQSRSDRDTYIIIETNNIIPKKLPNFSRHDEDSHYGPYDFDSVMHYDACAFSTCANCSATDPNCRTITVKAPYNTEWQTAIGQNTHLSEWDQKVMSFLYPPSNWRFADITQTGTGSGTFLNPYNYFLTAGSAVPNFGTVALMKSGIYAAVGTHTKPMTILAPLGGAFLR